MVRLTISVLSIVSIFFAALVLVIDLYLLEASDIAVALNGEISTTQHKAIDLLAEHTKLVIAASIGLLGFLIYFIKSESKVISELALTQVIFIILGAWCSLASIYFGHRVISLIVEMLANDYFSLISDAVGRAVILQYIFLFTAVLLVIVFILHRHATNNNAQEERTTFF